MYLSKFDVKLAKLHMNLSDFGNNLFEFHLKLCMFEVSLSDFKMNFTDFVTNLYEFDMTSL